MRFLSYTATIVSVIGFTLFCYINLTIWSLQPSLDNFSSPRGLQFQWMLFFDTLINSIAAFLILLTFWKYFRIPDQLRRSLRIILWIFYILFVLSICIYAYDSAHLFYKFATGYRLGFLDNLIKDQLFLEHLVVSIMFGTFLIIPFALKYFAQKHLPPAILFLAILIFIGMGVIARVNLLSYFNQIHAPPF